MPTTYLWAINNRGKVFNLPSNGQHWEELVDYGVDFKRISAVQRCVWAIGGDHQIYVYVFASDVPIRFKEITFENQRWNPKDGFCNHLLPTDRPHWSSQNGLNARPKDKIKLPTLSWEWEADWSIEDNLDGQPLGKEGWMYAMDFPMTYYKDKKINSFVRRRKWIRYRRYIAMDKWTSVPSIHEDPVREPFIDISVGGLDLPGGDSDTLAVWTVTVQGRVMFRYGVTYNNPEGEGWIDVTTPKGSEVNQISISSTGLVWAVSWDGKALVRLGITRERIMGISWKEVPAPNDARLLQVAVGVNVVWAVSRDGKVWFRKGIQGTQAGINAEYAVGSGWVEMTGDMSLISVGPNDQVWALGRDDDKTLYFRNGVVPEDLCGKTWKSIVPPLMKNLKFSDREANFSKSESSSFSSLDNQSKFSEVEMKLSRIKKHDSEVDEDNIFPSISGAKINLSAESELDSGVSDISATAISQSDTLEFSQQFDFKQTIGDNKQVTLGKKEKLIANLETLSIAKSECSDEERHDSRSNSSSPRFMRGSLSSTQSNSLTRLEDAEYYDEQNLDSIWCWVNGGGCNIDSNFLPNWFSSVTNCAVIDICKPWRKDLLEKFLIRYQREMKDFVNYSQAVDKGSWIRSGKCQLWTESRQWAPCKLELEQTGSDRNPDSAILSCCCFHMDVEWKMDLKLVKSIVCINDRNRPVLAIHHVMPALSESIKISFNSDTEMYEWIASLNTTCQKLHCVSLPLSPSSLWAVTVTGDVYFCEEYGTLPLKQLFWCQIGGGHLKQVEACRSGVIWGLGYNHSAYTYSGGWGGGIFQGFATSNTGIYSLSDVRYVYTYENQRWNPVTGFSPRGLPTDRYMWSDRTGRHECTKENIRLPSIHWQWVTDWAIDYHTPGGVDSEGWQYAKDFPCSYHAYKSFADYVRRRRWYRKCKLTTSGPWKEVDSIELIDVSLQIDNVANSSQSIQVWAIDKKGNVLCRHNVTKLCPEGKCWEHVPTDQEFISISVGGNGVWAVAKDGTSYFRSGISKQSFSGKYWFPIESPKHGCPLRQISAGDTVVWSVDVNGDLWFRQEIMPMFPEGTCWKYVCSNIRKVSIAAENQVWAIMGHIETEPDVIGVICKRLGITPTNKIGSGWEYSIGGGWNHICARSYRSEKEVI